MGGNCRLPRASGRRRSRAVLGRDCDRAEGGRDRAGGGGGYIPTAVEAGYRVEKNP